MGKKPGEDAIHIKAKIHHRAHGGHRDLPTKSVSAFSVPSVVNGSWGAEPPCLAAHLRCCPWAGGSGLFLRANVVADLRRSVTPCACYPSGFRTWKQRKKTGRRSGPGERSVGFEYPPAV